MEIDALFTSEAAKASMRLGQSDQLSKTEIFAAPVGKIVSDHVNNEM